MAMSLDEQHAAYDQQFRAQIDHIGLDGQRATFDPQRASSSEFGMQIMAHNLRSVTNGC